MKTFLSRERREPLRYTLNRIIAKLLRKETFWDYDLDGEGFDGLEYSTLDAARNGAQEYYDEKMTDYNERNDSDVECTYIQFFYDRNDEIHIMRSVTEMVEFVYERSDREEHFCQRDYI